MVVGHASARPATFHLSRDPTPTLASSGTLQHAGDMQGARVALPLRRARDLPAGSARWLSGSRSSSHAARRGKAAARAAARRVVSAEQRLRAPSGRRAQRAEVGLGGVVGTGAPPPGAAAAAVALAAAEEEAAAAATPTAAGCGSGRLRRRVPTRRARLWQVRYNSCWLVLCAVALHACVVCFCRVRARLPRGVCAPPQESQLHPTPFLWPAGSIAQCGGLVRVDCRPRSPWLGGESDLHLYAPLSRL